MIAWFKARLAEPNSRRAIAYAIALAGYYGLVDAEAMHRAGLTVEATIAMLAIVDQFVTKQAPRA